MKKIKVTDFEHYIMRIFKDWSKTFKEVALTGEVDASKAVSTRLQAIGFALFLLAVPAWIFGYAMISMAITNLSAYALVGGMCMGVLEPALYHIYRLCTLGMTQNKELNK
ncbi:hypothetical protein [Burkholderia vietnamiensis]|uniref:hypothetical protein n=1 Tax=Burkholderia vietnamiensis TaxID=60552 RepID=UPI00158E7A30|nr:hypothetical protein [Burkholderia vietnamiensis]